MIKFTKERKDRVRNLIRMFFGKRKTKFYYRKWGAPDILHRLGPYNPDNFIFYEIDFNTVFPKFTPNLKQKFIRFTQEVSKFLPLNIIRFCLWQPPIISGIRLYFHDNLPLIREDADFYFFDNGDNDMDIFIVSSELRQYTITTVAKRILNFLNSLSFEIKNPGILKTIASDPFSYCEDIYVMFPLKNAEEFIREFEEKLINHNLFPFEITISIFDYEKEIVRFDKNNPIIIKYSISPFEKRNPLALFSNNKRAMSKILNLFNFFSQIGPVNSVLFPTKTEIVDMDMELNLEEEYTDFIPQDFKIRFLSVVLERLKEIDPDVCLPEIKEILKKIYFEKILKI